MLVDEFFILKSLLESLELPLDAIEFWKSVRLSAIFLFTVCVCNKVGPNFVGTPGFDPGIVPALNPASSSILLVYLILVAFTT